MNLHEHKEKFEELIAIVADYIGVPVDAVRRDYYIVQMMQNLQNSEYAEVCVFKGGTSLSKCYPGSINRFSEDIDLTFIRLLKIYNKKPDTEKQCLAFSLVLLSETATCVIKCRRLLMNRDCLMWYFMFYSALDILILE